MQKTFWILVILAMTMGGCGIDWFPATVRSPTTPNDFSFTPAVISGVIPGSTQTSNTITISGIQSGSAPISVSGDPSSQYSVNGATYVKTAGTVKDNDTVTVQHTAASGLAQTITTTLTIGNKSASFFSTTANVASFNVTGTGAAGTSVITPVTLNLVPGTYTISVANGTYSLDRANFFNTSQIFFFSNGETIYLQNIAALTSGGVVTTSVIIDGVTSTYTTTAL